MRVILLCVLLLVGCDKPSTKYPPCVGASNCSVCKNCSSCKWCKAHPAQPCGVKVARGK